MFAAIVTKAKPHPGISLITHLPEEGRALGIFLVALGKEAFVTLGYTSRPNCLGTMSKALGIWEGRWFLVAHPGTELITQEPPFTVSTGLGVEFPKVGA